MRGDYNTLSPKLQKRHDKNTKSLNKVTIKVLEKYTNNQCKEVLQKLMDKEIFSLRITRQLFIKKINHLAKHSVSKKRNKQLKKIFMNIFIPQTMTLCMLPKKLILE